MLKQANDLTAFELNERGVGLLQANHPEQSIEHFESAHRQDASNGEYANNLAIALFQCGRFREATACFEAALTGDGDQRVYVLNYADFALTQPRLHRRGLEVCERFLDVHEDPEVRALAGQLAEARESKDSSFVSSIGTAPEHARFKVNGEVDPVQLQDMGDAISDCILENLGPIPPEARILDFGVGLGRVLWPMTQKLPCAEFVGFDVDPVMLTNLAEVEVLSGTSLTHTTQTLPDDSIDRAYVISVFTHLSHTTDYWLYELARVLKPGGRAFVTYHDESLYEEIRRRVNGSIRLDGVRTMGGDSEGSTHRGTYYETPVWEEIASRYFRVVRSVPRGLLGHQSFSIFEKDRTPGDVLPVHRRYIRDLEDELYKLRHAAGLEI